MTDVIVPNAPICCGFKTFDLSLESAMMQSPMFFMILRLNPETTGSNDFLSTLSLYVDFLSLEYSNKSLIIAKKHSQNQKIKLFLKFAFKLSCDITPTYL